MGQFAVLSIAILGIFVVFYLLFQQFKKCPANHVMIICNSKNGYTQPIKFIHGGLTFVWPIIQNHAF